MNWNTRKGDVVFVTCQLYSTLFVYFLKAISVDRVYIKQTITEMKNSECQNKQL